MWRPTFDVVQFVIVLWRDFICVKTIAGHRHRGRCRRHRHSGILYLSPVPEHFGTGLSPLIPVPNWFRHRHFCSFRYRTAWMPDSPTFRHLKKGHVRTASVGGGERDTHAVHVQTAGSEKYKIYSTFTSDGVIPATWYWKIIFKCRNVGMPEKS